MQEKQSFILSFIFKPVTAWVLNILIVVIGLVSFNQLSTRMYPIIESPVLAVETTYSDAGPDVIESQITKPIEEQLMGITGLKNISSSSTSSTSNIYLVFHPWANMIEAYNQVQTRVAKARSGISTGRVTLRESRISKSDPNSSAVLYMMLTGADFSSIQLGDVAVRYIKPEMESISGIAALDIWGGGASTGSSAYQMDINVSPDKLNSFNLTFDELLSGVKGQIYKIPFGLINDGRFDRSITIRSEPNTIQAFANDILIKRRNEYIPLGVVADSIQVRSDDPNFKVRFAQRKGDKFATSSAVGVAVKAQARQSPIGINNEFQAKFPELKKTLPKGMQLAVIENTADIITDSVNSVYRSLFEAILFVFVVILFFLQSGRASLIPMITIPICLTAGFAIMYTFNYTINLLTLLAMVLATGLVVDDAVVVLENIYKYLEKGESRLQAAIKGTKEIQFSIIAMTLTLAAVYAPIALVPGLIGSLFSEFAFTLTGMVVVSGFTALVLSPMMCARILDDHNHSKQGWQQAVNNSIAKVEQQYQRSVELALNYRNYVFGIGIALAAAAFLIFKYVLPSTLAPDVDSGRFHITFQAPTGIKMEELDKHVRQLEEQVEKIPELESYYSQVDASGSMSYIGGYLKKGSPSCNSVLAKHEKRILANAPVALSNVRVKAKNLKVGSADSAQNFTLSVQSNKDYNSLVNVGEKLAGVLAKQEGIAKNSVMFDRTSRIRTYTLTPNRKKAAAMSVDLAALQGLGSMARGLQAGYFTKESRRSEVYIKAAQGTTLEQMLRFSVRNNEDKLVPLGEIVQVQETLQRTAIPRQSGMRSFTIFADIDPSYSVGSIYENFKAQADRILPDGYRMQPTGALEDYLKESGNTIYIILLSLVFIFLILAAQFESFIDPLIIMGTVPLSWIGAVIALYLASDGSFNIFSGIGLLTLVGLVTKHGILIVDFANQNLAQGMPVRTAIIQACATRFRPILMTTAAMVLGAVPLVFSSGVGYEIRRQIGLVIVGGMSFGTLFTLLFVPCIYVLVKNRKSARPLQGKVSKAQYLDNQ